MPALSSCLRATAPSAAAKRYPFTGRVVSVDSQAQSAIIDGDAIPGFMDAMAMPYKIKPAAAFDHLLPGRFHFRRCRGRSTRRKNEDAIPDYWLENVKTARATSILPSAAARERAAHARRRRRCSRFFFTNQSGKRISLKQYRGQRSARHFYLHALSLSRFLPAHEQQLRRDLQASSATNPALAGTHLLSISFDPEHDTPKVLRDYGYSVAHTHERGAFQALGIRRAQCR